METRNSVSETSALREFVVGGGCGDVPVPVISSGKMDSSTSRSSCWSSTPIVWLFALGSCAVLQKLTCAQGSGSPHGGETSGRRTHPVIIILVRSPSFSQPSFLIPLQQPHLMAKTKPSNRAGDAKKKSKDSKKSKASAEELLTQAAILLQTSQPDEALVAAKRALNVLQPTSKPTIAALPALNILGETYIELGDPDSAREAFQVAILLDPEGLNDGAEKFLWLAQLNEDGGAESVKWFEKGIEVLRREIDGLDGKLVKKAEVEDLLEEKKMKIANSLCGIAEVYMTDLSWEADAEARCEAAVTEALMVAPNNAEPLQTLASIRISQLRKEDAQAALKRSIELWKDLEPDDPKIPDFPTLISLARLLMEADLEDEAIEVLERLVNENDSSIEAWYLGGWCLHLLAGKQKEKGGELAKTVTSLLKASREWLDRCLQQYALQEYEDERLKEHVEEILAELEGVLGPRVEGEEEEWSDEEDGEDGDDDDEDMEGA